MLADRWARFSEYGLAYKWFLRDAPILRRKKPMARQKLTMDGNNAAGHVSYAFTDLAAIYPITPSSVMAEVTDSWSTAGRKNIFGEQVKVVEMQFVYAQQLLS